MAEKKRKTDFNAEVAGKVMMDKLGSAVKLSLIHI